jgi:hydroxymethylbilane synthase
LEKINHKDTYRRAHIERNILKVLEGDCETAIGAHSIIEGDRITVEAELFSLDGSQIFYEKKSGNIDMFKEIGTEVGNTLKIKSNNSYKK